MIWLRKLELLSFKDIGRDEDILVVFRFLETLPKLQVLIVRRLRVAYLFKFISSIRHTALLELDLLCDVKLEPIKVEGPPTVGLAGLKKLSVGWYADDNTNEPGSSLAHLYELIRPTLTTLVHLTIDNGLLPYVFDLHLLKPAADTLRTFYYTLQGDDESILDTIPAILPHLTNLTIIWINLFEMRSIPWKVRTINLLPNSIDVIFFFFAGRAHPSSLEKQKPHRPNPILRFRSKRTR